MNRTLAACFADSASRRNREGPSSSGEARPCDTSVGLLRTGHRRGRLSISRRRKMRDARGCVDSAFFLVLWENRKDGRVKQSNVIL